VQRLGEKQQRLLNTATRATVAQAPQPSDS